ncbi:MAG: hypothetical protein MJZ20_02730, partial [Bacteroidaceae bacterium]|nr:hypothetical protein [Bacteroidaceae bacterium]
IENYIGKALENVANLSDAVSRDLAAQEDAQLKASVEARTREALAFMDEADPNGFNYEEASARAAEIYNSAFDGFNGAAVRRFNRDNPEHSAMMDLSINKVALEKTREQAVTKINSNIPKYASDTVLGYMNEVEFDQVLEGFALTSAQRTALKDKYKHDVDMGKVQFAIAGHDWKTATDLINATEKTNTLSAEERYRLAQNIESASHEAAKRIKEKRDNFQELQIDALKNHVKSMQLAGKNAAATELIDMIANGKEVVVEFGGVKVNTKDIAPVALDEAIRAMRGFDQSGSQAQMTKANALVRAQELITVGKKITKDGTLEDKLKLSEDIKGFIAERGGYITDLDKEQKEELEYLRRSVSTSLLENTISARDTVVYNTAGGLYSTAAPSANVDLSLTLAAAAGALPKEEVTKVKDSLMSGLDVTASLEMASFNLENYVLTGDLVPESHSVGKFAEYTYLALSTASPATLEKLGMTGVTPQAAADAYTRFLSTAVKNKDIYRQEVDSEEGFNAANDVFDLFVSSIFGERPEFTQEQKSAIFGLKANILHATKGYGTPEAISSGIPYYKLPRSTSMWSGKSNLIREPDVAYPSAATQNFLKNK